MAVDDSARVLKVGWVGAGFLGQVAHLVHYPEIPQARIVALAEMRPNLARRVAARYDIPRVYDHHTAMLSDPEIEAVVAIVQRPHTGPVALDVLNAGYHLFTEKPMAQTADKAEKLVAAARANNLRYAVGHMRRHDEGVQLAKKTLQALAESGELGDIIHVRAYVFAGGDYCNIGGEIRTDEPKVTEVTWPIAPQWVPESLHNEYERFVNVCSHDVNLIRYLFGTPKVTHVEHPRPEAYTVVLDFGDFSGVLEACHTRQHRWDEGVEVVFERGRLALELPPAFLRNQPAKVTVYKDRGKPTGEFSQPRTDWTWSFQRQDEAFVCDVLEESEPLASGADTLEDWKLIDDTWRRIVD